MDERVYVCLSYYSEPSTWHQIVGIHMPRFRVEQATHAPDASNVDHGHEPFAIIAYLGI